MTKSDYIDIIKLLSALETALFIQQSTIPDNLLVQIDAAIEKLTGEVLK